MKLAACVIAMLMSVNAYAYNRQVLVINDSSETIVVINGSSVGSRSWEENIIYGRQVYPGHQIRVNFNDGTGECEFDLRAVSRNGTTFVMNNYNVCRKSYWRLVD
jgi:hypothetical protein